MQTSTLSEIIKRERIPADDPIFGFRRENGKGIIEFSIAEKAPPLISPEEAIKRLESLQVDLGRTTDSVKIIRSMREERIFSRPLKEIKKIRNYLLDEPT